MTSGVTSAVIDETFHSFLPRVGKALAALPLEKITTRAHADELLADTIDDASIRGFALQNLLAARVRYTTCVRVCISIAFWLGDNNVFDVDLFVWG